jgi:anti-repressor protein
LSEETTNTAANGALQIFDFEDKKVRIVIVDDQPCFVAKDIVEAVGAIWSGITRIQHVPEEWRGVTSVVTSSGIQEMQYLTESGLYFYLARSDKPAALPFQKKVAGEVLPMIRKFGVYMTKEKIEEILFNPDLIIGIAQNLKNEQAKCKALEAKVEADKPKVAFAESVEASITSILIGDLAKLIKQNGYDIGQRRLFEWLRQNGYLMKNGDSHNMPTQKAMNAGLFEVKERTIYNPDGSWLITRTTKVTGKGQIFFINKFLGNEGNNSDDDVTSVKVIPKASPVLALVNGYVN